MNEFKENRFLIIEDEEENRDLLLRILVNDYEIESENIFEAANLVEALEAVDKYEPNIILLDLKIPTDKKLEPEMINAYRLIDKAELFNLKQTEQKNRIKIIVISGSIKDEGVQKIIKQNKNIVYDFIDKSTISENLDKFRIEFKKLLEKALRFEGFNASIEYSQVRRSLMKDLQKVNPELWNKIDTQILQEFQKLNDRKSNDFVISKSIIGTCGEIVEDIVILLEGLNRKPENHYSDNENSIMKRLTRLTGRKFLEKDTDTKELVYEIENEAIISRIALEYALFAYRLRSQALHSKEGDSNNNKWFYNHKFNMADAAVSIDLIIPLVIDYIKYSSKQEK